MAKNEVTHASGNTFIGCRFNSTTFGDEERVKDAQNALNRQRDISYELREEVKRLGAKANTLLQENGRLIVAEKKASRKAARAKK